MPLFEAFPIGEQLILNEEAEDEKRLLVGRGVGTKAVSKITETIPAEIWLGFRWTDWLQGTTKPGKTVP
jgi:hypothetical protein